MQAPTAAARAAKDFKASDVIRDELGKMGYSIKDVAGADLTLTVCLPGAGPSNYRTACRETRHHLEKNVQLDLELPTP